LPRREFLRTTPAIESPVETLRVKATQDSFTRLGAETLESTPEAFARFMRDDLTKWTKVVRAAGIKLE
jgi:tripartite-type tricarboxylate transporter receptor subunit TctC